MPKVPLTARVVEVLADLGEGCHPRYRVGSGCIVAGRTVLTAAHVVTGAAGVQVRDPGKVLHPAMVDAAKLLLVLQLLAETGEQFPVVG